MLAQLRTFALLGHRRRAGRCGGGHGPGAAPQDRSRRPARTRRPRERPPHRTGPRQPRLPPATRAAPSSTSPPPICGRTPGRSTCPSRSACSSPPGNSPPTSSTTSPRVGELALDGAVRPVAGALSMAMEARARGVTRLIVPGRERPRGGGRARGRGVRRRSLAEAVGIVTGRGGLRAGVAGDGRGGGEAQQVRHRLRRREAGRSSPSGR